MQMTSITLLCWANIVPVALNRTTFSSIFLLGSHSIGPGIFLTSDRDECLTGRYDHHHSSLREGVFEIEMDIIGKEFKSRISIYHILCFFLTVRFLTVAK